jgi:transglutaminase-like putative cysteine protease
MNLLLKGRCVTSTLADRCIAIRSYVRSSDLTGRAQTGPAEPGVTPAGSVARWMRGMFASGRLRYIKDPEGWCDLWRSVWETFENGGGDCDDLAIVTAAVCDMIRVPWTIVVGTVDPHSPNHGHAWVEGTDGAGWFLIEPTARTDNLCRHSRPVLYRRQQLLTMTGCVEAPEFIQAQLPRRVG